MYVSCDDSLLLLLLLLLLLADAATAALQHHLYYSSSSIHKQPWSDPSPIVHRPLGSFCGRRPPPPAARRLAWLSRPLHVEAIEGLHVEGGR